MQEERLEAFSYGSTFMNVTDHSVDSVVFSDTLDPITPIEDACALKRYNGLGIDGYSYCNWDSPRHIRRFYEWAIYFKNGEQYIMYTISANK